MEKNYKKNLTGPTYVFKKEIAEKYGLESAIIIQYFQYSINNNKIKGTNFHEGRYWTYNSIDSLINVYPFLSLKKIRNRLKYLLDNNVLISGNFNPHKYDRTKWYAFKEEEKFITGSPECSKEPVGESVDNHANPVDNPVDSLWMKNTAYFKKGTEKTQGKQPIFSKKSSVTRREGHLPSGANAFARRGKPIPIVSTLYSSIVEVGEPDTNQRSATKTFKSLGETLKEPFQFNSLYTPSKNLREKLNGLGYDDDVIHHGIKKMLRYHESNPQIIRNEHSCVLGWFKKYNKFKGNREP